MKYRQITREERYIIAAMRKDGKSTADIAKSIGKSRSTIYRELQRNLGTSWGYNPSRAQERTNERRRKARRVSWFSEYKWKLVEDKIRSEWSPEQISLIFRMFGIMRVSHETIYLYIWRDMRRGGSLYKHLRHSNKKRRKRYRSHDSRGVLGGKRDIEERPIEAENRSEKGHFEIDLVHGKDSKECILTLVDRMTRFLIILKLMNKTNAEIERKLVKIIKRFDIKTITADNGTEWHGYEEIEKKTNSKWYFAKPYHSWERGTNENTNGLIRQYLPKNKSMSGLTQEECDLISQKLNRRPRKVLNLANPESCHLGIPLLSHF
jgi:transposase, IS30 family